jgi:hypothetical protein
MYEELSGTYTQGKTKSLNKKHFDNKILTANQCYLRHENLVQQKISLSLPQFFYIYSYEAD